MPVDIDSPEAHIIRKMVPFSTMPNSIFKVICDKIVLENVRSGAFLFKRGDTEKELVYLLKGEVSLEVDKLKMEVIKAGTESARFALAHQLPRKVNGVAKGSVQCARLNSVYITAPDPAVLKKHQSDAAEKENGKESAKDWMNTLMMIPNLRALQPSQLSKINEHLEEVRYREGEVVVRQGEAAEYYYLIKIGECLLSHKAATPDQTLTVTKLKMWDSFGAEALISDSCCSQTVTALDDLCLLRINKENFLNLIKQPLIRFIDEQEVEFLLARGGVLLDVRTAADYETSHAPQAINMPLLSLRNDLQQLDKGRPVVVISDDQNLSASAVFVLLSYKFSACVSKKNTDPAPAKLVINVRKPAMHSFSSAEAENDVVLDLLEDEAGKHDNNMLIKTRSIPKHADAGVPEILAAENAKLMQQVKELTARLEKAEQEWQQLSQKHQLLLQQFERLKAMLTTLKNNKAGN